MEEAVRAPCLQRTPPPARIINASVGRRGANLTMKPLTFCAPVFGLLPYRALDPRWCWWIDGLVLVDVGGGGDGGGVGDGGVGF